MLLADVFIQSDLQKQVFKDRTKFNSRLIRQLDKEAIMCVHLLVHYTSFSKYAYFEYFQFSICNFFLFFFFIYLHVIYTFFLNFRVCFACTYMVLILFVHVLKVLSLLLKLQILGLNDLPVFLQVL